jgi:hypothetical protein
MELDAQLSGVMNTYAGHRFFVKRFANEPTTLYRVSPFFPLFSPLTDPVPSLSQI